MKKHLLIFQLVILLFSNLLFSQSKIALVIGNRNYAGAPLRNPVNDATDIAKALQSIGFDVTLQTDRNLQQMEADIRAFGQKITTSGVALFYFSGHGTQVDGINYLFPIGQEIYFADEIRYKCVPADMPLAKMESAGSRMNILILDACRSNPFKGFRSQERGLATMAAPTGTFIAYATAPGSVALDGKGFNSPYTSNLLNAMKTPGLKIEEVFKKVREKVMAETGNKQVPWESSSLIGEFYFTLGTTGSSQMSINNNNSNFTSIPANDKPHFKWEADMVFVKGGTFTMGCTNEQGSECLEGENPTHQVTLDDFYIGKYEVTQKQWQEIMGNNPSRFSGCDNCPVDMVSWTDVQIFITNLNQKTGKNYRLPTEAEWEYAARGGVSTISATATKYAGSSNINEVAWYDSNSMSKTHPVGHKKANGLGIYDMTGNVVEWCNDWYIKYENGNQYSSKESSSASYSNRVIRGGGWGNLPNSCRIANRNGYGPEKRNTSVGFRLAIGP